MKTLEEIQDYKEAAEILNKEFAALNWIVNIYGGMLFSGESGWKHYAFQVEFVPPGNPGVAFDWKQGTGLVKKLPGNRTIPKKPNPSKVLACCCADYISASDSNFDDWAAEFGYDSDSIEAINIYSECLSIGPKLKALGLSREQISRFAGLANMLYPVCLRHPSPGPTPGATQPKTKTNNLHPRPAATGQ